MNNPYAIWQHPETGRWELRHGNNPAIMEAADREWLLNKIRHEVQATEAAIDRLMDELASARFRRDALAELLEDT